jgi:hypothetical protein
VTVDPGAVPRQAGLSQPDRLARVGLATRRLQTYLIAGRKEARAGRSRSVSAPQDGDVVESASTV